MGEASFNEASTRPVLAEACQAVGLSADGARLLRVGENAIYRLDGPPVVVRIARGPGSLADVRKEVRVARWLEKEGFPAIRLAEQTGDDPLMVGEHFPTTFWRYVPQTPPDPDDADLGSLLRELHDLRVPDWVQLPPFTPFARVADRLASAPSSADPDDVRFLADLFARLQGEYADLTFVFPASAVHGDAHLANLIRDETGAVLMLDFEAFAFGHREWDLTVTGVRRDGFDWLSDAEYQSFVEAYGYDIHDCPGFGVLRAIRELTMTTWLMQLTADERAASEFHRRVDDIRNERYPRRWRPF